MRDNQGSMLSQDRDILDHAHDRGPTEYFNNPQNAIPVGHDQQAMLHSNAFGHSPPQGPYASAFGLNSSNDDNDDSTHFNVLKQDPKSASYVSNQATSTFFNTAPNDFNANVQEQNQGSPDQYGMPYQDLTTLLPGQNQGAINIFHPYFSDQIPSSETIHTASGHHPLAQELFVFGGDGDGYSAASHLAISSRDQHPPSHGQNGTQNRGLHGGFNGPNSPAQQLNTEANGHHQSIAHSFHAPLDEPQSRSHDDSQGGRRSTHASPAHSMAPHLFPGVQSSNLAAELSMPSRGRLNLAFNGLHTPILAPLHSSNIQHSPPRRAFHSPLTPDLTPGFTNTMTNVSPPIPSSMTRLLVNDAENLRRCAARDALIRQRLVLAEYLKKLNLQCFKSSSDERSTLEDDLATGWERSDANENLQVLYAGELRLMEVNKLSDKYAQGFRMCEEEIEELWGDLVVPDEQRSPDEAAIH